MDKVRGCEEKYLSGVMDPSLNSHFHLHITANVLVLIHFYEFLSARQLREYSLPPEVLFWELRCLSFRSSTDGSRNAWDASEPAWLPRLRCHHLGFYGPMASLRGPEWSQESRISAGGSVQADRGWGLHIQTRDHRLHLLHLKNTTMVRYKMFVCCSLATFFTDFFIKKNKNLINKKTKQTNKQPKPTKISEVNVCHDTILRIS